MFRRIIQKKAVGTRKVLINSEKANAFVPEKPFTLQASFFSRINRRFLSTVSDVIRLDPRPNALYRIITISIVAVLLSSCMARRARIDEKMTPTGSNIRTVVVSEIAYDEQGLPHFDKVIADRPSKTGEHYTIVVYDGQKAVRSFDIALVPHESADPAKPFKVIYAWTRSGYQFSVRPQNEPTRPVLQEQGGSSLLPDPAIRVAYAFSMTVGGFIVGLVASVPAAVLELANVPFSSRERLVSFTDYSYDNQGRLAATKMFLPSDRSSEIVHTEFFYEGEASAPSRAEIRSLADGSVKTVP